MEEEPYGKRGYSKKMTVNVIFTGLYRAGSNITNMSLQDRISIIKNAGANIHWFTWEGSEHTNLPSDNINIVTIKEPYPHVRGIEGRQRQIYNVKCALSEFSDDDIILKLRWDLDFSEKLLENISNPEFFDPIKKGIIKNKIWTGFFSVQELFSPADVSFAGYKKDLNKLINYQYRINGVSANHYISHDGMMLMPKLIEKNKEVCDLIKLEKPDPWGLFFKEEQYSDERYCKAWAFSYFILEKYFKTGPLGTSYFKRGDLSRWPYSFVDYENFTHNYDTMCGRAPKLGLYPRYRVYDDIFMQRLVNGHYKDPFAKKLFQIINNFRKEWEDKY